MSKKSRASRQSVAAASAVLETTLAAPVTPVAEVQGSYDEREGQGDVAAPAPEAPAASPEVPAAPEAPTAPEAPAVDANSDSALFVPNALTPAPQANGKKYPRVGGKCRAVWDKCDELRAAGTYVTVKHLRDWATLNGANESNASQEFYAWRKFHAIS